jgi:predicted ester cyclase
MSEENKELVRRSWAESGHNPDIFDEVYAPDALWHLPDRDIHGVEEMKQYVTTYVNAFPDASVTVEDEIAEGDKVVNRFTIRGTHQGEIEDLGPPTGRRMEQKGMAISRIEGGRIVEEWQAYDNLSVMQQLGLAPEQ